MMNEHFGELLVFGAVAVEGAVAAAHATIPAIFAAVIGNFDDSAHENLVSEARSSCQSSFFMKCLLSLAV